MTTTIDRASTSDLKGQVLTEAGKAMLPVLAAKVLAAVVERLEHSIDQLADRLGEMAESGGARRDKTVPGTAPAEQPGGGMLSMVVTMSLQQARVFLDLVVRLLAQAAAAARTAAERLRARRAPEGTDSELAELEDGADDELDEDLETEDERTTVAV